MTGKLRNMTSIYLLKDDKVLLLFRKGGRVVSDVWTGSAGGHFEEFELNEYYGSNVPLFRRNGYRQSGVMIP